ncbi:MAG: hypothetical protein ACI4T1_01820 [Christensenellales bacterium]
MKNYIDHDVEVKYYDALFERSKNWQWFVNTIEQDFYFDEQEITSWKDYNQKYQDISEIYEYFIKIHQSNITKLQFKKTWLKKINLIALLYNQKINIKTIWSKLDDTFFKLFALNVYITVLLNKTNNQKYFYSAYIFTRNNIFDLFDLSEVVFAESDIINYLNDIKLSDIATIKRTFLNNIHQHTIPYRKTLFKKYSKIILSSNSFKFRNIRINQQISWQEQFFYDMLSIEIKDKELVPILNIQGRCYPDFTNWSPRLLNNMKLYFNNETANFIIETIDYILHKNTPSEDTISTHFSLEIKHLKKLKSNASFYDLEDSSFQIISYLLEDNLLSQNVKNSYMKDFSLAIHKFMRPQTLSKLKECFMPISDLQNKKIKKYNQYQAALVKNIKNINDFRNYCENKYVAKVIKDTHIIQLHKLFLDIIRKNDGLSLPIAFYHYMILLIRAKQSPNLKNINLERIMIDLKDMWKNSYYKKSIKSMQEFSHSQIIKNEEIEKYNYLFINSPITIAKNCFPNDQNSLLDIMSHISENVFSVHCTQYIISQNYPIIDSYGDSSEIDKCFLNKIEDLIQNKGYKFLNVFDKYTYAKELFKQYNGYTLFNFSLFNEWRALYDNIRKSIKEYQFLDINEDKVLLGHVTQLFPIIENKIRKLGTFFGIAPFKEDEKEFIQSKEPSSILIRLLQQYYNGTHNFVGVSDLLFTYYALYNNNSLNIRNECVHGNSYQTGDDLLFAFKVTLVCLKMILNRIEKIENQISSSA